jgi:hypothetical protein
MVERLVFVFLSQTYVHDRLCCSPEQAREIAEKMIGARLITKQTGAGGRICNAVGFLMVPVTD